MKYSLKEIMTKAWELFRKNSKKNPFTFAEALHRAWMIAKSADENAEIIRKAKEDAGIEEETHQWYGWKLLGREVIHESKCLFQCVVKDFARGDGATRVLSFFGISQTAVIA